MVRTLFSLFVCCFLVAAAAGCSSPDSTPIGAIAQQRHVAAPVSPDAGAAGKIKHVIIIVQENRSFVNLFAGFPGADAPTYGYTHDGTKVDLTAITFKGIGLNHGFNTSMTDWDNGKMDGFDKSSPSAPLYPYSYLKRNVVQPYWTMAEQYVLADHMFPTQFGGSFSGHLNLIAGTDKLSSTLAVTDYASNTPWGCDAPTGTRSFVVTSDRQENKHGPFPCFTQWNTMADVLDKKGVTWKYYAPQTVGCSVRCDNGGLEWSAFDAIKAVRYGPDWNNVVHPQTTVLDDAKNGNLAAVSWVIPDHKNSDHPDSKSNTGPSWVASVVNAIGQSQYWNSSAIVIVWDDWGGWYDDVPPPQLDFLGLGIRVGCIIISPYAKNAVIHTQYESGSILKFVEHTFGAASLGYSDARANSIADSFDFNRSPRAFTPIPSAYKASYFLHQRPSGDAPDDQ
ncbi:MAG: alkaline phosphatase family protein [Candidatus Tumulicola sp.]